MTNNSFLKLINPQIVKAKDVGHDELDERYMVEFPAFVGYQQNLACSVYLPITDKLLSDYSGNELNAFILAFQSNMRTIMKGTDDFKIGTDYFISESLYDYLLRTLPEEEDSSSEASSSSEPAEDSSSSEPIEDSSSSDDSSDDGPRILPKGIVIIEGPDINATLRRKKQTKAQDDEARKTALEEIAEETEVSSSEYEDFDNISSSVLDEIEEDFAAKYVLPDYIWYYSDYTITQNTTNWYDLSDTNNKDMANLTYFYGLNSLLDNTFTLDELNNLPATFFKIILKYAVAQNYYTNTNNQVYNLVMKYFANSSTDDAYTALTLILGTMYGTSSNTSSTCGCNVDSETTVDTSTCAEKYVAAMQEWLKSMLGDTQYYYDWFFIPSDGQCPIPNDVMIDLLIELLNEFLDLNYDLSFTSNANHCACPEVSTDDGACNRAIIQNYIKVLNWVKNNDIDANANKIKVYGQQFGELLPKLVF